MFVTSGAVGYIAGVKASVFNHDSTDVDVADDIPVNCNILSDEEP